ncbi:DUF2971 domain-containing protein [Stenotrophomonas maltophilia]|uniref:DUF2971 domain-containing protein n=1 Tax=Stenotrophomonas maltophilia TaxID=40324 RepID=UPI002036DAB3|nr:DUF2971 domain-containing protein [Stenotrophomonas maltophilia]MCM2518513.1 DUF2971 domain-containing protein [Stenotrophomonas maltophilia]
MNDYLEMHWGYNMWQEAATQLVDTLGQEFLDRVDAVISGSGFAALPLASCLSTKGDTLSQWRAYASDGLGFSIGFDAERILDLPASALAVCYSEEQQVFEIIQYVKAAHWVMQEEPENDTKLFELAFRLAMDLSSYKNPAFAEESEVRLVHLGRFEESGNGRKLIDMQGTAFGEDYAPQQIKFFMKQGSPVAHIDLDFIGPGGENPIRSVIVGPKNQSLTTSISIMLETLGLSGVDVVKSEASYR